MSTQLIDAKSIVAKNREYTFFSWSVQKAVQPIPIVRAEGVYFWDAEGKRYLDFSSQLMNLNIGHQHPKVIEAIKKQAETLCFAHPGLATIPRGDLGEKIAEVTPGDLKKTFFCLGGQRQMKTQSRLLAITRGGRRSSLVIGLIMGPRMGQLR